MLYNQRSPAKKINSGLRSKERQKRQDNVDWVVANQHVCRSKPLFLFGGRQPIDFRIRIAEAHLRSDFTPSAWSHVAAAPDGIAEKAAETRLLEVSLSPANGFANTTESNGIQVSCLEAYRDPVLWPNIAMINLPSSCDTIGQTIESMKEERALIDLPELIVSWLAFGWGVGQTGNPLFAGHGVPSAVLIGQALASLEFDLTPGLESRASCPEAIWQAVRWWHPLYEVRFEKDDRPGGVYWRSDELVPASQRATD